MPTNSQLNSQQIDSKIHSFITQCQLEQSVLNQKHPEHIFTNNNQFNFSHNDAGVMVLLQRKPKWEFILTQKSKHLNKHAGQVAFPGGKFDTADTHILNTAYRETHEEIGIPEHHITPIYCVKPIMSRYNVNVHPILATLDDEATYQPDYQEVSHAFSVPIDYFVQTPITHYRVEQGLDAPAWKYEDFIIWGFTAGVLAHLIKLIFNVESISAFDFRPVKI